MASRWSENESLVLSTLERVESKVDQLQEKVAGIDTSIAILKLKSGIWGAAAGLIPGIGFLIYEYLKK